MPIDSELMNEFNRVRARCHSTQAALYHARVRLRIAELRERNLFDALWEEDSDFNLETYLKDYGDRSKHDENKLKSEFKREYWSVKFLMVYMGVNAPSQKISVEDMHATESLSWILLSESNRRWKDRLWEMECFEVELASQLSDFWIYDPDPLVMMVNAIRMKKHRRW